MNKNNAVALIGLSISLLVGCDKLNESSDRIKDKLSWVYTEDVDKLNNYKIQKAKKEFKNTEGTLQADVEFQCSAGKVLTLQIGTYQTKAIDGTYPGASLKFKSTSANVEFIKTRTGETKLAFPLLGDKDFNNIAKISLKGIDVTGLGGLPNLLLMIQANVDLSSQGYKLAADGKEIPKFFKTSEWIIEVPTENGTIIPEIDMAHKNIQKIFESCNWTPEFMSSEGKSSGAQSTAGVQQQGSTQDPNQAGQELIGKLISADQGDESCGLKIFGQDKKEISLSATFDLCDDDNFKVDKTYKFKYGVAEFPNCGCDGKEECNSKCKTTIKRIVIVSGVLVK